MQLFKIIVDNNPILFILLKLLLMKKYFLISNSDFTCEKSSDNLKDIIKSYYNEINYRIKNYWSCEYNEFSIYKFLYNSKKIDIDYGMDWSIYFIDKLKEIEIEYEDFEKYWIKQKEIKKDFLYHNNRK